MTGSLLGLALGVLCFVLLQQAGKAAGWRRFFKGSQLLLVLLGGAMLMSALIVMLAIFLGREFIDLPPVLDSYWRPIHVGIASISYGVVLVCFSIAVLYLIKDGYNVEAMGVFVALMGLGIYGTINRFAIASSGTYGMNLFFTEPGTGESAPLVPGINRHLGHAIDNALHPVSETRCCGCHMKLSLPLSLTAGRGGSPCQLPPPTQTPGVRATRFPAHRLYLRDFPRLYPPAGFRAISRDTSRFGQRDGGWSA